MLLTTQGGIVVNFAHVAYVALKRADPSPSQPQDTDRTFRVLLLLAVDEGNFVVAARGLTENQARFVREDIAHHVETNQSRWKASESLKRHAEGAYFASEDDEQLEGIPSGESEVENGKLSALPDL